MHPVINDVETGRTTQYPDLQPQRFDRPPDEVFEAVKELAGRQPRWTLRPVEPGSRTLQAVAVTRLLRFRDDVTLWVEPDGDGAIVFMRSRSRLGKGDLGVNAKRIRSLQLALAREVTA